MNTNVNPMQIFEVSMNYINNRVVEKLQTFTTLKEKEKLYFDILGRYNSEYKKSVYEYYKDMTRKEKNDYFDSVISEGIYMHIPPLWKDNSLFDVVRDIYKDYPWIKPQPVYVNRFGRKIKMANDILIGEEYIIKLKQSSKKGFSARSAGALSKRGVPEKSFKNKVHQDIYSQTPLRHGDQENINAMIGVVSGIIAQLHQLYRSSPIGRRDLGKALLQSDKLLKDIKSKRKYVNRNVEILQALLKSMGLRIKFFGQSYIIDIDTGSLVSKEVGDKLIIGTDKEIDDYKLRYKIDKKYRDDICFVGTTEEYDELIDHEYELAKLNEEYYVIDID